MGTGLDPNVGARSGLNSGLGLKYYAVQCSR